MVEPETASVCGHRMILLILLVLLRLSDDLGQHRNNLLQNGADVLLRQLTLWRPPIQARCIRGAPKRRPEGSLPKGSLTDGSLTQSSPRLRI